MRIWGALAAVIVMASAVAEPTPEQRYQAAQAELKKYCEDICDLGLGKDPAEVKALDTLWDATQDWTLAFLTSHPASPSTG